MKSLRAFGRFWYDFVVGDDWTVAASVVLALALTAVLAHLTGAWIVLPLAVLIFVGVSLWRALRRSK